MDLDRALVTKALQTGAVSTLLGRGVEGRHFAATPSGQDVAAVYDWAAAYSRRYNVSPSVQLVRERWPDWRGEPASDPLEALIDAFMAQVKRRAFSSKVRELAQAESDPAKWNQLDEMMLDAARDLATLVPSGGVLRFSEMSKRIEAYEQEQLQEQPPGFAIGIPSIDEAIQGGIKPGNVITIAGYMNLGKSLLSGWVTLNAVEQGRTALFLPLEMTASEVLERIDNMVMNFSSKLLATRALSGDDIAQWRRIALQYSRMENDLIVPERLGSCTIDRVYAEINRYRPDVTVVDYVQLMRRSRASMQKWEGLDEITNELKAIALSTDSVVVMVSQDGRSAADGGSTLSNMSGHLSVGQACDVYIGLEQTEEMRAANRMRVKLLKNRRGPRDFNTEILWDPSHMRFDAVVEPESNVFVRNDNGNGKSDPEHIAALEKDLKIGAAA